MDLATRRSASDTSPPRAPYHRTFSALPRSPSVPAHDSRNSVNQPLTRRACRVLALLKDPGRVLSSDTCSSLGSPSTKRLHRCAQQGKEYQWCVLAQGFSSFSTVYKSLFFMSECLQHLLNSGHDGSLYLVTSRALMSVARSVKPLNLLWGRAQQASDAKASCKRKLPLPGGRGYMHGLTLRFRHGAHTVYTADGCASTQK